ncbi:xanthine dehydrogenase accessory protein XdhC [Altererythrobacter sp. B11]|uniref:xanthine dehydrogenase accessory protein XdhC n=1 Tax=Altererythrobacter sp. B11 TaxID=2060312 RepID=UPI000DC6E615|nr:xanthine dehydrogenase accessory protein XdhC [Altererythrobacter sp. B11]BBC73832.1 xanthine dehydrogenase accessory protein XdhC [Altererythrobacter sp. B11]
MTGWLEWLRDAARRKPVALVSVLATEGSAPRGAGTRMLVTAGTLQGTIGGGKLEYNAVEQARAILGLRPGSWRIQDYPLGPLLGQCCGGRVRLLVEHVDPAALDWLEGADADSVLVSSLGESGIVRTLAPDAAPGSVSARGERPGPGAVLCERIGEPSRPLYLFGAGHVGQAVVRHASALPFRLAWFDTRAEQETIDGVTLVATEAIETCVAEAPAEAAIVIMTHDHALDYRLTIAALSRNPVAFVGLIGSATKKARFLSRLRQDGLADEVIARLTCPIGIPGLKGKEPDVIAIATLAQLLQLSGAR